MSQRAQMTTFFLTSSEPRAWLVVHSENEDAAFWKCGSNIRTIGPQAPGWIPAGTIAAITAATTNVSTTLVRHVCAAGTTPKWTRMEWTGWCPSSHQET